MATTEKLCACGIPLHYENSKHRQRVQALVEKLGESIVVQTSKGTWLVPRHYIALHGLKPAELPEIAERYGFKRMS